MDQISTLLAFIEEHESLFSGIAAIIAILGMGAALILRLNIHLRAKSRQDKAPMLSTGLHQNIHYTRAEPGVRIAWSAIGKGRTLVRSLGWFTNLEVEWNYPGSRACIQLLANQYRYIRYDARGMGMSERNVTDVSAATRLLDLEAVMDAAEVDRCILMGVSEGGTTAIEYSAKHPDRVSHLILWGSFLKQPDDPDLKQQWTALSRLIEKQWDSNNRGLLQMLTSIFLPDGDAIQNKFFNTLQKESTTGDIARRTIQSIGQVDVSSIAATLKVPTLVIHRTGDLAIGVELGRELAATIPGAKLVQVEGADHWIHADQSAFSEILEEINKFVANTGTFKD